MSTQQPHLTQNTFNIEAFKALYATFNKETIKQLDVLYSADIIFKDPIHELQGMEQLKRYFEGFYSPSMQCRFNFCNQIVSNGQAFFQWQMHYTHTRLNKGKPLQLNGGTLIKFSDRVYYHEDFYDMGAMIYQHLPVLGWAIKKINARIVSSS